APVRARGLHPSVRGWLALSTRPPRDGAAQVRGDGLAAGVGLLRLSAGPEGTGRARPGPLDQPAFRGVHRVRPGVGTADHRARRRAAALAEGRGRGTAPGRRLREGVIMERVLAFLVVFPLGALAAQPSVPASPLAPADAVRSFRLADDNLVIELVAAEPD